MFVKGDIVRLKCYDDFESKKGQLAEVNDVASSMCNIIWFKDRLGSNVDINNLEKVKLQKFSKVADKIKVGDIIITNADGSRVYDNYIYGEVGEIGESHDKKCLYLWNNTIQGSSGEINRPSKWKYSWSIYLSNRKASIILMKEKTMHSIEKDSGTECEKCGKFFDGRTMKEFDGNKYCTDCFDELFTVCVCCGELTKVDGEYEFEGDQYCEECYGNEISYCSVCGHGILRDNGCCNEDGDTFCEDCYSENYCHCNSCGCEMNNDSDFIRTGADDNTYCADCFDERFGYCEECGEVFRNDDLRVSSNGDYYCDECFGEHPTIATENGATATESVREVKVIHDYGFKPTPEFKKMNWDAKLFMGLELEVQHKDRENIVAKKLIDYMQTEKVDNMFYMKHDSSVCEGFEIVTHPFTLAWAHKEMHLQKILKWMKDNEFTSEESGDCGLHIHLSRDFFEDLDLTKLRLFFKQNEKKLNDFSGRKNVGMNFCQFEKMSVKDILKDTPQSGRYWALNLNSSTNTVEIRMFRGTLDSKRLTAILQFADAISHFVKEVGVTSIFLGEREYKKNSWKLFTDWAKDERKYGTMLNYMKGEKLCV